MHPGVSPDQGQGSWAFRAPMHGLSWMEVCFRGIAPWHLAVHCMTASRAGCCSQKEPLAEMWWGAAAGGGQNRSARGAEMGVVERWAHAVKAPRLQGR